MDRWINEYVEGYIKQRKKAVMPKGQSTAEYLIECKEKASASCIEFETMHEKISKTPSKTKTAKTPLKKLEALVCPEVKAPSAKKVKFDVPLEEDKSDSQSQWVNGLDRKILVHANQHRLAFIYKQPRQLVLIETFPISN